MPEEFSRNKAIGASLILTVLTLTVFFILQDYGPESVIRRFHQAALEDDRAAISQTVMGGPDTPWAIKLQQSVRQLAREGYRYEFSRVIRLPRQVYVNVVYYPPGFPAVNAPGVVFGWVVQKPQRRWEINPRLTLSQEPMTNQKELKL